MVDAAHAGAQQRLGAFAQRTAAAGTPISVGEVLIVFPARCVPLDHAAIVRELRLLIDLPDWTIGQRWHGVYASLPGKLLFVHEVEPGVTIVTATGGCGTGRD